MTPERAAASLHHRVVHFDRRRRATIGTRCVPLGFARALITEDLPFVYDQNAVWVEDAVDPVVLVETVEQVAAEAGWRHRAVEVADADLAGRLRLGLRAAGYTEERDATMVLKGRPPAATGPNPGPTAVVPVPEQLDIARALLAEEPWVDRQAVVDQFDERERRLAAVDRARAVVAPPQRPVSRCLLFTDGPVAEIDEVGTLAAHRGQGWSGAVVRRAIDVAWQNHAEHVVVVADEDDWPRGWYARLGFRQVGILTVFRRSPAPRQRVG